MRLSIKICLLSVLVFFLNACDTDFDTSPSSSGSSGSSISGSSSGSRGSCFTESVCVYYFNMGSSKYAEISSGCTTSTGWVAGVNSCSSMVGNSRTQICQQTASDGSIAQTYSYGHTQAGAQSTQNACEANGGSGDILNF